MPSGGTHSFHHDRCFNRRTAIVKLLLFLDAVATNSREIAMLGTSLEFSPNKGCELCRHSLLSPGCLALSRTSQFSLAYLTSFGASPLAKVEHIGCRSKAQLPTIATNEPTGYCIYIEGSRAEDITRQSTSAPRKILPSRPPRECSYPEPGCVPRIKLIFNWEKVFTPTSRQLFFA